MKQQSGNIGPENPDFSYDDLIFRGRNKEYGAYQHRKVYNRNVFLATIMALSLVFLAFFTPWLIRKLEKEPVNEKKYNVKSKRTLDYSQLSAPPPIELQQTEEIPQIMEEPPQVKTVKFLPPKAVPDEDVVEEDDIPTQDVLKKANIGNENIDGVDSLVAWMPAMDDVNIVKTEEELPPPPPPPPVPKEEFVLFAEKEPEFPGGMQELKKFFAKNIIFPAPAKEADVGGRVVMSFVVRGDGSVSSIKLLQNPGYGFGDEAIRVAKKMPPWIPGESGGKTVSVRFILPVDFKYRK